MSLPTDKDLSPGALAELLSLPHLGDTILGRINELREGEGNSVEICSTNPDPDDANDHELVIVNADWTEWMPRNFKGATLLAALDAAVATKNIRRGGT